MPAVKSPRSTSFIPWPPLALAACLLATALAGQAATDPKSAKFYEDALTRYEKRDIPGAIIQLRNALQLDKNSLPVQLLLGKALLANGDVAAADVALNEALRLGVNRVEVVVPLARAVIAQGKQREVIDAGKFSLTGLPPMVQSELLIVKAMAHADVGDQRNALKAVEDARAADPGSVDAWLAEVPIRIRARQFKEALAAVAKAASLDPKSPEVVYQNGAILHVQGDKKGALSLYDRVLDLDASHVEARVARVGLFIDLQRDDAAAKDVAELVARKPQEPRGWYLGALLAERQGKQQQVRNALARITELLDPVPIEYIRYRPQVLLLAGQAHYGLGEREKAKPFFEAFQRVQPGTPVSKLMASIYLAEQNHDQAVEALEQYLRAYPHDAQGMALLASAHMAKGRHARAAGLMQDALQSRESPELYTAYGLSLIGVGQSSNALAQLEMAYKKDPAQTQAAYAMVGLYIRGRQPQKALTVANALVLRHPSNPSFQNLLGLAKVQNRDIAGARAAFEHAIKLDSTLLPATLNLARLETDSKNFERARMLLDAALKDDARNSEVMFAQAELTQRIGKSTDTLRWLQKAYDVAGAKDMRSSLALVELHLREGRRADALKIVQEVSANVPDNLAVMLAMARVQLANVDFAGARGTLTSATRLANFDPAVQVEVGMLQLAARDLAGASYSVGKALASRAEFLPALVLMTEIEVRQGELDKAEARAQQVIKKAPRLAIGNSLLGDIAVARNRPAQAIEFYRKAHQLEPSLDTLGRLFRMLSAQDMQAALKLAEQWLKAHPGDIAARRMVAQAHVRNKDMAAAREQYERLRTLAPNDAGIINDLANVLVRLNDPRALEVAEQALAADPNSIAAIDTAGWIAFQAGKLDRAVQLLRDARLRSPEQPEVRYHLAAALVKMGRTAEARDELQFALRARNPFEGREAAEALVRTLK
ncbi:XrtA/PEP-CTERM system TPR-repeat protein PrsT [Aquabacterium sp.]|uniref:XrtA/PEP-CTERM system TPR-repeat protein PrsT n=1 Tax=Aquabacterium sp. TaxID=1872578 RepID=UPI002C0C2D1E|nr:XrtA/PEP-CTERM system TPR-repeat protein PrsT [Aquabacterium sp.]HSW07578.1 XrtA/PEP-CTERM system TPR-repeat protein PrsT [Aquabacterium sp.]